ncbi:MAG: TRAM domain-containing protein, partial [Candidatus Cloacimonetes bacterium]|nr:TRAM domain-containing protein [Candidatus Cloacimonadota bacterium]
MDENTIKIEKLAHLGYGLGYLKGKTLFVPFTLPGDEVQVKIIHQNKNVAFA